MDHQDHDKQFLANFGKVMAGLFAIFFICIAAARVIVGNATPEEMEPATAARLEERIKPVAEVVTDPAALVAKVDTAAAAREPMSGEDVTAKLCSSCHAAGVLNAPKEGDKADWSARMQAAGGLDGLVDAALHGKNAMPPKGGDPSLSDDEVRAAVEFMLSEAGL